VQSVADRLASIKDRWDTGEGEANLYQQMIAARDAVRASR
jgi:hypothetical protein